MKFKLVEKRVVSNDIKTFIFEPEVKIVWQPGQYMHYVLDHPNPDERGTARWFTISNPPYLGQPSITTRFAGEKGSSFKRALGNMQVGDVVVADGPKGKFVVDDPTKHYIFIAGGIGITPFHSILLQLDHDKQPINVDLMYANRDDNFIFDDELQKIAATNSNFKVHKFVSPKKIEEADIIAVADKLSDPQYYISGPKPMVEAFDKMLAAMGVAEDKIHNDDFPGYATI